MEVNVKPRAVEPAFLLNTGKTLLNHNATVNMGYRSFFHRFC